METSTLLTTQPPLDSSTEYSGHVAFMFISMGLVQLMTPGLAFFYGGLVRSTNAITIVMQSFFSLGFIFVLWYVFVFSLAFGESIGGFVGNPATYFFWRDVPIFHPITIAGVEQKINGVLYAGYQGMFAVITPALMTGAFADRVRLTPYIIFFTLWIVLVYGPVAHWVWGGGWMSTLLGLGVKDFAGGLVVHTTSGFSALASLFVLGRRSNPRPGEERLDEPHNVLFVALGTAMLWFGWFGFNGGSAVASGSLATVAALNSQLAASVCMVCWAILDVVITGKAGLVGACVGAVAGLATVTPAAGFVNLPGAFAIGIIAAGMCYSCVLLIKKAGLDDALDVWGVHGMGGFTGTIMIGLLADPSINGCEHSAKQLLVQVICAVVVAVYSFIVSYVMLFMLNKISPVRPAPELEGSLDVHIHGEVAYVGSARTAEEVEQHKESARRIEKSISGHFDGAESDSDSDEGA